VIWPTLTSPQQAQLRAYSGTESPLLRRPDLAGVVVSGKHRGRFLHALLTQEIDEKTPNNGLRACFCTPQGKILATVQVFVRPDDIVIATEASNAEQLIAGLLKFRVAERVKLAVDETLQLASSATAGRPILLGERGDQDGEQSALDIDPAVLDALRVQAGVPLLGQDIDDGSTPLEVGLWDSVSWSKGCYLGQEAIAMMAYRGKLRRHLCWVEPTTDALPSTGQLLRTEQGKRAGVVGTGFRADGRALGLAMIQRRAYERGAIVFAQTATDPIPLRVIGTTIADAFEADPSEQAA
jgi:tRNA-modifying protein YgfZ